MHTHRQLWHAGSRDERPRLGPAGSPPPNRPGGSPCRTSGGRLGKLSGALPLTRVRGRPRRRCELSTQRSPLRPTASRGSTARAAGRLEDLTLTVEAGEVFGYLSTNGAGKTTTIRLTFDFIRLNRGSVRVLGAPRGAAEVTTHRSRYLPGQLPSSDGTPRSAHTAACAVGPLRLTRGAARALELRRVIYQGRFHMPVSAGAGTAGGCLRRGERASAGRAAVDRCGAVARQPASIGGRRLLGSCVRRLSGGPGARR